MKVKHKRTKEVLDVYAISYGEIRMSNPDKKTIYLVHGVNAASIQDLKRHGHELKWLRSGYENLEHDSDISNRYHWLHEDDVVLLDSKNLKNKQMKDLLRK